MTIRQANLHVQDVEVPRVELGVAMAFNSLRDADRKVREGAQDALKQRLDSIKVRAHAKSPEIV